MPVYAFEAVPREQADSTLYVPLFRRDWFGTSGIAVLNPGDDEVEVQITFRGTLGTCTGRQGTQRATAPPHASVLFYPGDPALPLPSGPCAGAATIRTAGDGVVAIVNEAMGPNRTFPDTTGAYNAVGTRAASKEVALPLFRKQHLFNTARLSTGVQVMNVGTATASAQIVIIAANGTPVTCQNSVCRQSIAPGAAYTWFPPSMAGHRWTCSARR
jgi:hypothetical protein